MTVIKATFNEPAIAVKSTDMLITKGYPSDHIEMVFEHGDGNDFRHLSVSGIYPALTMISSTLFAIIMIIVSLIIITGRINIPSVGLGATSINPVLSLTFDPPVGQLFLFVISMMTLGIVTGVVISAILSLIFTQKVHEDVLAKSNETSVLFESFDIHEINEAKNVVELFDPNYMTPSRTRKAA